MAGPDEVAEHPRSYYAASAHPAPARPPLQGDVRADVCVVGAGYSGLSVALELADRGFQVIVLEAARVGWGASGRNGGQLVNGFSRDLDVIEARYGQEAALALAGVLMEGGEIIRERVERYRIRCDLKPTNVFAAYTDKQMVAFEEQIARWQRHGIHSLELLDREALQRHVTAPVYIGGLIDHRGGHLHPLNLALGEAAALESLGGMIHEQSRVVAIEQDRKEAIARTANGSVRAPALVLCGNAYLGDLMPVLASRVMPAGTQILATEPLGEARARALIPSDTCVEDANFVLDYFRLSADHRLLFGGGTVYGGARLEDLVARLRPRLAKVFPDLGEVRIDFAWSGNIALTLTRIPDLGRLGKHVYFTHGYSGHGVTATHLCGRLVAEAVAGDASRFDVFANLRHYAFPGGRLFRVPLTALGAWWYGLRDRLGV